MTDAWVLIALPVLVGALWLALTWRKPLTRRPTMTRRDDLTPLRSVSAAYKRSQIEPRLRSNQEHFYEPRKSIASPACRTAQAGGAVRDGGAEATARALALAKYQFEQQRLALDIQRYYQGVGTSGAGLAQQAGVGNNLLGVGAYPWANVLATPPEPEKPLPVEIRAGELTAWRCWRIIGGGKLCSMTQPTVWEEGNALEGDIDAGVGIHAWKTEAQARSYAAGYYQYEPVAIGTVELWGQVIEHEEGYRAQFGQIKEIVERMEDYRARNTLYQKMVYGTIGPAPNTPRKPVDPLVVWLSISAGLMAGGGFAAATELLFGAVLAALGLFMFAVAGMVATNP